ncbi:MAG: Zn-dependent alcohol dehydrogenase [Sphingomonadales bacterium]|nr:Zn-dependent alcohol dehydrogenase [Sphingomonadales bacterium]
MKAAVLRKIGEPMTIEDVAIADPIGHEVLVRVAAVGLCHSDLHVLDGAYPAQFPAVLGHEVAGVVEQVGPHVRGVRPGDQVVVCLSFSCGHCEHCQSGNLARCMPSEAARTPDQPPRLTSNGEALHAFMHIGGFAEKVLVHESGCIPVDASIALDRACLVGCGVTTGFGAAVRTAGIRAGESAMVIGCGGVGLAAVNGAAVAGARQIIAVDRVAEKLEMARRFGATHVVDASAGDVAEQVMALTNGRGVDHAIEAIGRKDTIEAAFDSLAKGGTATVVGVSPMGTTVEISANRLLREVRLQGSNMGSVRPAVDIPHYLDLYRGGKLHLDPLVSRTRPLSEINEAIADMREGRIARTVITFEALP